jgi:hypothetical protein
MDIKELTGHLEHYAVSSGHAFQLFYHDGWHFKAREADGGFWVCLAHWLTGATFADSSERFLINPPSQAVLIRTAVELMREVRGTDESLRYFADAKELAGALETSVDRAFPGSNYAFGYFYREAWTFEGKDNPEGPQVWLNFQFDSENWKQTNSYILPNVLTKSELEGWTKTIMDEALNRR